MKSTIEKFEESLNLGSNWGTSKKFYWPKESDPEEESRFVLTPNLYGEQVPMERVLKAVTLRCEFNFMWTSMKNMWMNESIFYRGNTITSRRSVNMKVMWYKRLRESMYGCCGAPLGNCPPTDHMRKAGKGLLEGWLERELAWEKGNTD
jgi:hypothetical protein